MVKVAAVQMQPALMDKGFNLDKITGFARQAADQGCQLAVFPECALTGYALTKDEAVSIAEPIPGPASEALSLLSTELGMAIMVGTLEADDANHLYNTAILVDPGGLRACYRKTHLPTLGVDRYVTPGDALPAPTETAFGRAGMLICYDLRFPEPARVLALGGAQLILVSARSVARPISVAASSLTRMGACWRRLSKPMRPSCLRI
jgi:predicted amidohydrolase